MVTRKNNILWTLGTAVALSIGFLLLKFVLFDIHGMGQWTFILFIFGSVVIVVAAIFKACKIMISTPLGYVVGFVLGLLFNTDGTDIVDASGLIIHGGSGINNWWQIWTISFVAIVVVGVVWELLCRKNNKRN